MSTTWFVVRARTSSSSWPTWPSSTTSSLSQTRAMTPPWTTPSNTPAARRILRENARTRLVRGEEWTGTSPLTGRRDVLLDWVSSHSEIFARLHSLCPLSCERWAGAENGNSETRGGAAAAGGDEVVRRGWRGRRIFWSYPEQRFRGDHRSSSSYNHTTVTSSRFGLQTKETKFVDQARHHVTCHNNN